MSTYQNGTIKYFICILHYLRVLPLYVCYLTGTNHLPIKMLIYQNVTFKCMFYLHTALSMGFAWLRMLLDRDDTAPANCSKHEINLIMCNVRV